MTKTPFFHRRNILQIGFRLRQESDISSNASAWHVTGVCDPRKMERTPVSPSSLSTVLVTLMDMSYPDLSICLSCWATSLPCDLNLPWAMSARISLTTQGNLELNTATEGNCLTHDNFGLMTNKIIKRLGLI